MFKLKELLKLYLSSNSEFDDPDFAYRGSGARCILAFHDKIFTSHDLESFTTDLTTERLEFVLKHIREGVSEDKVDGIVQDCRAFLCFLHYGDWLPTDFSWIFMPANDTVGGFRQEHYKQRWKS